MGQQQPIVKDAATASGTSSTLGPIVFLKWCSFSSFFVLLCLAFVFGGDDGVGEACRVRAQTHQVHALNQYLSFVFLPLYFLDGRTLPFSATYVFVPALRPTLRCVCMSSHFLRPRTPPSLPPSQNRNHKRETCSASPSYISNRSRTLRTVLSLSLPTLLPSLLPFPSLELRRQMRGLLALLDKIRLFQAARALHPSLGQDSLQLLDTKFAVVRLAVHLDGCGGREGGRKGGREGGRDEISHGCFSC